MSDQLKPKGSTVLVAAKPGGLKRMLHKEKFAPVRQLLRYVYPQLEPRDQAKICLELISYMYPKHGVAPLKGKPGPKIQINTQVNTTPNDKPTITTSVAKPEPSVDELLELAAAPDDTDA